MFGEENIVYVLDEHAIRRARHPALIENGNSLDYAALAPQIQRFSAHLRECGIREDEIVGVCLRDSGEHLVALFALARIGAVILPLDWRWTLQEKTNILQFFKVGNCLVEPEQEIPDVTNLVMNSDRHAEIERAKPWMEIASGGNRPLLLSLSSGTTGRPKGPMVSHRQFAARLMIQWVTLGFSQHDRYLSAIPLYFGGGRSFAMGSLYSGGTVIMFPPPHSPEDLVSAVREHSATTILLVPTLLRRLLELPDADAPLLEELSRLISTGAALHPDERRQVMERLNPNFINYYGSTEGGGITVLLPEHGGEAAASVGEPVFATKVQIVGDDNEVLPSGETGQVRFTGPSVADSFFNDPKASLEAFHDGWFYPGDLGYLDDDGRLFLTGRARDVIIRGGVNIYPREIEEALIAHPDIHDAAVVGWPNKRYGELVAAFVIAKSEINEKGLQDFCSERLVSYKVPSRFFVLDEFPKSPLGKVLKTELARTLPDSEGS